MGANGDCMVFYTQLLVQRVLLIELYDQLIGLAQPILFSRTWRLGAGQVQPFLAALRGNGVVFADPTCPYAGLKLWQTVGNAHRKAAT